MKVWDVKLRIESPMILTRRRTPSGFIDPLKYIPSTTLRGAVLSALYRDGLIDHQRLLRESENPEVIASPAYPVKNGRRLYPAHPFIQECKMCKEIVGADLLEVEERLKNGQHPELKAECGEGHRALKPLHHSSFLLIKKGGVFEPPGKKDDESHRSLKSLRVVSVAISRDRASGVKGLLYSYEAIQPGSEYWATIAVPDELEPPGDRVDLRIGRGLSRGHGRASLMIEGRRSLDEAGKLREPTLFYALSPTIGDVIGNTTGTYPRLIELASVARRAGLSFSGRLEIERAYGRTITTSGGWDLARGEPRPMFHSRAPGSLLLGRASPIGDDGSRVLSALGYIGTIERPEGHVLAGFNMLVPVEVLSNAP